MWKDIIKTLQKLARGGRDARDLHINQLHHAPILSVIVLVVSHFGGDETAFHGRCNGSVAGGLVHEYWGGFRLQQMGAGAAILVVGLSQTA